MRKLAILSLFALAASYCSRPIKITANPDDHNTTTGTLGSAKSTYQLPPQPVDTARVRDTLKIVRDSLR